MSVAARVAGLIGALAAATLLAGIVAVVIQSQFVLAELRSLGAPIGPAETLRFTAGDVKAMTMDYALEIAPAFLVAFSVTAWLQPRTQIPRAPSFAIGGAAAIGVLLTGILLIEGNYLIAGSRGWGMVGQCAAGGAGGLLFARLTRRHSGKTRAPGATAR